MCKLKSKISALKIVNLILVLLIPVNEYIFAQDLHFSQIKSTPLFTNPAGTGNSFSDIRFSNDYRNQWRQIDKPYQTLMLALDTRLNIFKRVSGIGAMFIHDETAGSYLISDKFYISLSHSFFFKNNQFVIGMQPGYVLKKLSSGNISFGDQFDPDFEDFVLPTGESSINENLGYFDLNAGILWQTRIKNIVSSAGLSFSHLNTPIESFFDDYSNNKVPVKYLIHGNIYIPLTKKFFIEPQTLIGYTKASKEFIGSTILYYYPENNLSGIRKVYGISALRINPVQNFDALILGIGTDVAGFDICFTYDINISSLGKYSKYRGGYELSVLYNIGRKKVFNKAGSCFML